MGFGGDANNGTYLPKSRTKKKKKGGEKKKQEEYLITMLIYLACRGINNDG